MRITAVLDGRLIGGLLILHLISVSLVFGQDANSSARPELAPLSADYQAYLSRARLAASTTSKTEDGHPLGYVPARFDLPALNKKPVGAVQLMGTFPATFDLRPLGKVTPIRDQGGCGSCWAFSNMASLESGLLPEENWDFSENGLKNFLGSGCCLGGNRYNATAYFTGWRGPVPESVDPYNA